MIRSFQRTAVRRTLNNQLTCKRTHLQTNGNNHRWMMNIRTATPELSQTHSVVLTEHRIHFNSSMDLQSVIIQQHERKTWLLNTKHVEADMLQFVVDMKQPSTPPITSQINFVDAFSPLLDYIQTMSLLSDEIIHHQKECAIRIANAWQEYKNN